MQMLSVSSDSLLRKANLEPEAALSLDYCSLEQDPVQSPCQFSGMHMGPVLRSVGSQAVRHGQRRVP